MPSSALALSPDLEPQTETTPPKTIGELASERAELKVRLDAVAKDEKRLRAELDDLDLQIIDALDAQGTTLSRANGFTLSIQEEVVPNEVDWPRVYDYITSNDAFHLLQKRISVTAYREALQLDPSIAFATPFTKRSLSVRKV